ncbi:MAG: hypothetical protein QOG54_1584 [Actinomycetota bacterium]|nr:hypothetical protein [Actinomycetota bacterium]
MPNLDQDQLTLAVAIVGAAAVIAFLVSIALAFRLRRIRKEYSVLLGDGDSDLVGAVSAAIRRIDDMGQRVDGVAAANQKIAEIGRLALQKFHLVRYDAFDDMGGRLSFSAAVLDDHGDGVVITSINGRTETRTYAKPVRNLESDHNLSEEERAAIAGAFAANNRTEASAAVRG